VILKDKIKKKTKNDEIKNYFRKDSIEKKIRR
jgi:hypothetical protein